MIEQFWGRAVRASQTRKSPGRFLIFGVSFFGSWPASAGRFRKATQSWHPARSAGYQIPLPLLWIRNQLYIRMREHQRHRPGPAHRPFADRIKKGSPDRRAASLNFRFFQSLATVPPYRECVRWYRCTGPRSFPHCLRHERGSRLSWEKGHS